MIPLTPEQEKIVLALIAANGWSREAAELWVVESEEDVVEEAEPADPLGE